MCKIVYADKCEITKISDLKNALKVEKLADIYGNYYKGEFISDTNCLCFVDIEKSIEGTEWVVVSKKGRDPEYVYHISFDDPNDGRP